MYMGDITRLKFFNTPLFSQFKPPLNVIYSVTRDFIRVFRKIVYFHTALLEEHYITLVSRGEVAAISASG